MTMNDGWLLETARRKKARAAQPKLRGRGETMVGQPIEALWSQLQRETARQAKVYTDALGDPGEVTVETPRDEIHVKMRDGRQSIVRVDRNTGLLSETFRNQGGAFRTGRPLISLRINSAGELDFNCGLHEAAASLLRRMIS